MRSLSPSSSAHAASIQATATTVVSASFSRGAARIGRATTAHRPPHGLSVLSYFSCYLLRHLTSRYGHPGDALRSVPHQAITGRFCARVCAVVVGACNGADTKPLSGPRLPASPSCHRSVVFSAHNPCCSQQCESDIVTGECGSATVASTSSGVRLSATCGRESGEGWGWTWQLAQVQRQPPLPHADTKPAAGPAGPSGPSIRHASSTLFP